MANHRDVSTVLSRAPAGLQAPRVRVEVHLGPGLPAFALVGLPEAAVRESKERVRAALVTAGYDFPAGRMTVNLSPAELPKEGGRFDLPIAVGILAAMGAVPGASLRHREFYGELSLGGELRETPKLLPALIHGVRSGNELILPQANAHEAALVMSQQLKLAQRLSEVVVSLNDGQPLASAPMHTQSAADVAAATPDLADVRGQYTAKRALEIAAAGQHALLLIGPPGAGKTLLARCLPRLLPLLPRQELLEIAALQSAAGQRPLGSSCRPFRSPQHTASVSAIIGGLARPGEISLAHRGVLFLDELPEFPRNALEALREPLESGVVAISRLKRIWRFPAQFQLLAAMNPCPCGFAGETRGRCRCTAEQVRRYRSKLSGPLLDRIDLQVQLLPLSTEQLVSDPDSQAEDSARVAQRVAVAYRLQMVRQEKVNARLGIKEVAHYCRLGPAERAVLGRAIARLGLSARAYHRVLKVARTCADLAGAREIRGCDVAEAVSLRTFEAPTC